MPPAPTLSHAWLDWTLEPAAVLFVASAGIAYAAAVRKVRGAGGHWPTLRCLTFGSGLLAIVIGTMSWFGVYAHVLFSAYALELILLLVIAPILLALGGPVSLAAAASPQRIGEPLKRFLRTRFGILMSYPIIGTLLLICVPFLIYFTPWYTLTLHHAALYQLQMIVLPLLGFVFAWSVAASVGEVDLLPVTFAYGLALAIAIIELLLDALPGIVIRLSTRVIAASYYAGLDLGWHRDRLTDQQLGGAMWWFFGEIIDLPVLAILLVGWIRADRLETERVDERLDRQEAEPAVRTVPIGMPADMSAPRPSLMRPWWEEDASVFGIRAQFYQRSHDRPRDD